MFFNISQKAIFHKLKSPSAIDRRGFKVSIIGASGNVGAPTMMLLKMNPLITHLIGIDRNPSVLGVAGDLAQLNFPAIVRGYTTEVRLEEVLVGSKLVIEVMNSVPINANTTPDEMLLGNAPYIKALAQLGAVSCPDACFLIVTDPINSMVPLFCKILEKEGRLNPKKVFGMSNLASIRASSYIAELKGMDPRRIKCPVIGGHSSTTIVPVLSKVTPKIEFTLESLHILAQNIQKNESRLIDLNTPVSTMATAYATASLADSILRGLSGQPRIQDYAFVKSNVAGTKFFASPLIFGRKGILGNLGLPKLTDFEKELLQTCIPDLSKEVEKGENIYP